MAVDKLRQIFQDTADAIKEVSGDSEKLTPEEFPEAIRTKCKPKLIAGIGSKNGVYRAKDSGADGFSSFEVDVPSSVLEVQYPEIMMSIISDNSEVEVGSIVKYTGASNGEFYGGSYYLIVKNSAGKKSFSRLTQSSGVIPREIATEEEMNAVLVSGDIGAIYKYTGASGTYENGELYIIMDSDQYEGGFNLVTLGDSIPAGHSIDSYWASNYGDGSQYGQNGNRLTRIVEGCYTDLLTKELNSKYENKVITKSFARSGDKVSDLLNKLQDENIISAIRNADVVTICIGANDILIPAVYGLEQYFNDGNLSTIENQVKANFNILNTDSNPQSFSALIDRLNNINPTAKYIFTTIYNPYKYLHFEESTKRQQYKDGFLGPILGWYVPESWREGLYNKPAIQNLKNRLNAISPWAENYINQLNDLIKAKASKYGNVYVADSKLLFESIPDRDIGDGLHYNNLVNVEITKGYNMEELDWGEFWENMDWLTLDLGVLAERIVATIIEKVIIPDVDPHPEKDGHMLMARCFEDVLSEIYTDMSWRKLKKYTLSYSANGGFGSMASQEVHGLETPVFTLIKNNEFTGSNGVGFKGWTDSTGTPQNNGYMYISQNTTLNAQWDKLITIRYYKVCNLSPAHKQMLNLTFKKIENESGPVLKDGKPYFLQFKITKPDGTVNDISVSDKFNGYNYGEPYDAWGNMNSISVPASSQLYIGLINEYSGQKCKVYLNGNLVAGAGEYVSYIYPKNNLTNLAIAFEWVTEGDYFGASGEIQSYWNAYIVEE